MKSACTTRAASTAKPTEPAGARLPTFSKVNVKEIVDELDADEPEAPGGPPGAFSQMDGGAGGMSNPEALHDEYMAGGGLGSMDFVFDEWKATAMEQADVGRTVDCTHGKGRC